MRRIMPLVCSGVHTGICCFGRFGGGNRCWRRARTGGPRDAPKLVGRFLTPNNILLGKLPWFAMVLVTFGGCFALRNASCVYRLAGGNVLFWSIWEPKSLFMLRTKGRAPGRSHDTGTVPNPEWHSIRQTPMVCHGSSDVRRVFCTLQ